MEELNFQTELVSLHIKFIDEEGGGGMYGDFRRILFFHLLKHEN